MALTSAQIVNLAVQIAKCPGYSSQAGQFLNTILEELSQVNDSQLVTGLKQINTGAPTGVNATSGIPYFNLAADHLRVTGDGVFYYVSGVPYNLIQKEQSEFDQLVVTSGSPSQLLFYTVDDSTSPPQITFWPPPTASYIVNVRYIRLMTDISGAESSTTVPWFPLQQYLIEELAARCMGITNDDRQDKFHARAAERLRKWLIAQRDLESTALTVKLDRNRFSTPFNSLKNTKTVGF